MYVTKTKCDMSWITRSSYRRLWLSLSDCVYITQCFLFKSGNEKANPVKMVKRWIHRPTHLLESHVSGQMLKKEETEEGELNPIPILSLSTLHTALLKSKLKKLYRFATKSWRDRGGNLSISNFDSIPILNQNSRRGDPLLPGEYGLWHGDRRLARFLPGRLILRTF